MKEAMQLLKKNAVDLSRFDRQGKLYLKESVILNQVG